jgi:hypothetical protein
LSQELIAHDHVEILARFAFTPGALAGSNVSKQAKKLLAVMNAHIMGFGDRS